LATHSAKQIPKIIPQANCRLAGHFCKVRSARSPWQGFARLAGMADDWIFFPHARRSQRRMAGSRQRGISDKACDGQRLQVSGQRKTQVRNRRRSSCHSDAPTRHRRCANATTRLPLQLVQSLAPHEKNGENREGSWITRDVTRGTVAGRVLDVLQGSRFTVAGCSSQMVATCAEPRLWSKSSNAIPKTCTGKPCGNSPPCWESSLKPCFAS